MNNIDIADIPQPINDNLIMDLTKQLKLKYDQIAELEKKLKIENLNLKKDLITCYGIIRCIDNIIENDIEVSYELGILISTLKHLCSDFIDKRILNVDDDLYDD